VFGYGLVSVLLCLLIAAIFNGLASGPHLITVLISVLLLMLVPCFAVLVPIACIGAEPEDGKATEETAHEATEEDKSCCQLLIDFNFWCMWLVKFAITGCGIMVIHNLAQIVQSELGSDHRTVLLNLNILGSLGTTLGRMMSGPVSDALINGWALPRPVVLFVAGVIMSLAHVVLLAFGSWEAGLYIGTFFAQFAFGMSWVLVSCMTNELFGNAHMGMNLFLFQTAPPLGALVFSKSVAGSIYDHYADAERMCLGTECFAAAFAVCAVACFLINLLSLLLAWRTKEFYRRLGKTAVAVGDLQVAAEEEKDVGEEKA
jgi:hypothetical protein